MKKLGLISVVLAGVTFTAVGCASEAGLNASGSAQTSASPSGVQAGVGVDAGVSGQAQPGQVDAGASGSVSGSLGSISKSDETTSNSVSGSI